MSGFEIRETLSWGWTGSIPAGIEDGRLVVITYDLGGGYFADVEGGHLPEEEVERLRKFLHSNPGAPTGVLTIEMERTKSQTTVTLRQELESEDGGTVLPD